MSSTELCENIIVTHSRLLIVIRSGDLVLRCFRVMSLTKRGHSMHYHNLSSGQHNLHPVIQVSSRTE